MSPCTHAQVALQLVKHSMFAAFLFYKEKELFTSKGCVGVVIPWQLCRTIGPLLSYRLPLASAKAQPRGEFHEVTASPLAGSDRKISVGV